MNIWELIPLIAVANVVFHSKGSNYFNGFFDKIFAIANLIILNAYMHAVKAMFTGAKHPIQSTAANSQSPPGP